MIWAGSVRATTLTFNYEWLCLRRGDYPRPHSKIRDDLIMGAALDLLGEKGYQGLTMTDVAARAAVSKATLYRRWTAKADLVADAVATLNSIDPPRYPGTSLRDDLLALAAHASNCDDRPEIVTATMEMARFHPDLYQTLSGRFGTFVRAELGAIARRAADAGHLPLSGVELDAMSDNLVALLAHYAGSAGSAVPRERLVQVVDHVLMVLITGTRVTDR